MAVEGLPLVWSSLLFRLLLQEQKIKQIAKADFKIKFIFFIMNNFQQTYMIFLKHKKVQLYFCDPGGIQTPNLLIRSQMLYSVKLRDQIDVRCTIYQPSDGFALANNVQFNEAQK